MNTDALIALLANRVEPVRRHAARERLALAVGLALPLSLALMLALFGIRHDLAEAAVEPMFWVKVLFPASLAAAAFVAAQRLARPGVRVGWAWLALAAPLLLVWLLAGWQWLNASEAERPQLLWGYTWRTCPFSIALIAAPVWAASLWAFKGLAPTRPALGGGVAGALAGGVGALIYALHCPELGAPFLGVWYVAGITLTTVLGALIGARWLRW